MILKTNVEIWNWLKQYDKEYQKNRNNNSYEFIDIHDTINEYLLQKMILKYHLSEDYFKKLKESGHHYIVNVKGNVNISNKNLTKIKFQFFNVDGGFSCADNQFHSLKGVPYIVANNFLCQNNQLESLEYAPQSVGGYFNAAINKLGSLRHIPSTCHGLDISCNKISSFKGLHHVFGSLHAHHNQIKLLNHFPEIISGAIFLQNNVDLLDYRNQSQDMNIQKMSRDEFFKQMHFEFWNQFHLMAKIKKESAKILNSIDVHENTHTKKFQKI